MKDLRKWKFEDDKPKSPIIQPTTGTGTTLLTTTTSVINADIALNKEAILNNTVERKKMQSELF